jgi:chromosome segregation ATPase
MAELRKQPAVDYNLGQLGQIVQVMQTQKEPQATHFNFVNKAKPFDMPTSTFVEGEYGTKKVVKNVTDQGQVNQRLEDALVTMMDGQLERPAPSELERVYEASDAQARVVARIMKFYNHIKEGGRISPYDDSKDLVLTEEEIAIFKGYEQAVNKLREEQDKYRRSLEGEFKKLHEEIEGIGTSFLETMSQLEKKRRDVDNTIAKKELIAIQMIRAAQNAKEVAESERDMANQLVTLRRQREITRTRVANLTRKRDFVNHAYEEYMEEERSMDKAAATRLDNLLLKLYKKRGLESFDKPEKVDPVSWANFIEMKQAKLPVEKKVVEAQKLAQWVSMMLQRWLEFDDALARRLDDAEKQYVEFVKDCVFRDAFDVDVLLDVKQGQIEVDQSFIVTDYSQAILIRTDAVNKKNATIADCAKEKISLLHNIKELRRGIYALQWEQERLDLAAQDLSQRIRDVQLLRVTKSMQALVKSSDNKVDPNKGKDKLSSTIQGLMDSGEDKSRYGEQVHAAERTRLERKIEVGRKNAEMKRKERTKQVDGLERQLRRMQDENAVMDDQIRQLEAEAEERRRIYSAQNLGHESEGLQRKMKGVRASRKLQELAKAQQLELLALKQELDRLREKTFPSFAVQRKRQFGNPDER